MSGLDGLGWPDDGAVEILAPLLADIRAALELGLENTTSLRKHRKAGNDVLSTAAVSALTEEIAFMESVLERMGKV